MVINYRLKNYQLRETTPGKGIVKYLLMDEQGQKRVVSAIATLGYKNKVKSIHPIHHRELPLTDILFKSEINDKITVDFTEYNQKHSRDGGRKIAEVKTDKVVDPYNDSLIDDIGSLKNHKFRLFKLFLTSLLVVTAILFVLDGFFS